jgi:pimeloyl-ACP methyl ester carboxylesterase
MVGGYDAAMPFNQAWPPEPPIEMPPARTVSVPGRGEFFIRDTGGDGPSVMLLHGWIATADLNWWPMYGELAEAGYRVLAIDHRGHGRGLRPLSPFRFTDCAADAAGVLRTLGVPPAHVVGYSMGGAIAQVLARDHADVVSGLILSGTAQHWQDVRAQRRFRGLGAVGLLLSVAPRRTLAAGLRRSGIKPSRETAWLQSELMRHSVGDIVEAGRELRRFDSRPWLGSLGVPVGVVLTTRDELVSPRKQRELAETASAQVFEIPITHMDVGRRGTGYAGVLLQALAAVAPREGARAA